MSATNAFIWLSGTVTISTQAPVVWRREGLAKFYENPNHSEWGGNLCRILYHESIHFWQVLSSAYLANALQDEWLRLLEFEQFGRVRPVSDFVLRMSERQPGEPFSAHELIECWARYWDVHTRSPTQIIQEEQIGVADRLVLPTPEGHYTSAAFDLYMQEGKDAQFYAAPYRWMLEQCDGNSAFANIAFPILVFHAFGSPAPIALLARSLEYALKSDIIQIGVKARSGSINLDWLNNWAVMVSEAIEPARRDLRMPSFTGGWDVIARGRLGAHPIYRPYLTRIRDLFNLLSVFNANIEPPKERSWQSAYSYAVKDLPARDPVVIFAFPGQPEYRLMLGEYIPLPRIRFDDITLHAERSPALGTLAKLAAVEKGRPVGDEDVTFKPVFDELDARLQRFRYAEYAVSVGLPVDTFN